jgi:hypothetical protein
MLKTQEIWPLLKERLSCYAWRTGILATALILPLLVLFILVLGLASVANA